MEYDYSLSFHEGDSFSIEHDNRDFISPNVQPEKSVHNIYYQGNVDLQKFYEQTFQKAYEEHIQRQIKSGHGNRVKDWPKTYFEYITKQQQEQEKIKQQMRLEKKHFKEIHQEDKYQRIAKQLIVQVGNIDDFENLSPEQKEQLHNQMKEILKEYMETFQKENPNFIIVNAVIHVDEMSLSPHLHLTYVPVAEMKRGQRIQNSLNSSLKAMGFETDKEKDSNGIWLTAQMKWQAKERTRMVAIAKKHGLNIGYQKGNRTQTRTIDEYRKAKQEERIKESAEKVEQLEQQVTELKQKNADLEKKAVEVEFDITRKQQAADEQLADTHQEIQDLHETIADAERQVNLLDDMRSSIKQSIDRAEQQIQKELVVQNSPSNLTYERTTKGFGKNKETFVIVPQAEFDALDKVSYFNPDRVKKKVTSLFKDLRESFSQLPAIQNLQQMIASMRARETELNNTIATQKQKHRSEIEQLKKENDQLRAENKNLKSAAETFKKVLHTIGKKFNLQKEVNEELLKTQTDEKTPTRNNTSHDDHDGR